MPVWTAFQAHMTDKRVHYEKKLRNWWQLTCGKLQDYSVQAPAELQFSPTNNMSSDDRIHAANRSSKTKVGFVREKGRKSDFDDAIIALWNKIWNTTADTQAFRWTEDKKRDQDQDDTKEDKAVETQQDFDGELEDVKDAEESDSNAGEDGDDEEGDDEIKDGIGMVDPLESGAVDGKFWEGGHDDGEEPESNEAELSATENQTMPKDFDLSTAKENTAGGEQSKAENQRPRDEITGGEYGQLVRRRS
ncbi:hypothetical protein KEM48_004522 [Puccinia striiformis f. sp. tritici PST-130]|nr:hypothetical protein KEM48_004522 [Puccinia striiformis f. sp. tritici PST-130]